MSVVKTINDLNALEQGQFIDLLADIFEHSSWIAKNTWSSRPFISVDELHQVMCAEMQNSDIENQLALLRAHPELAGTAALEGDLTAASSEEQKGAGLTHLLPDEIAHITRLNQAYGEKFGFPFIIAVKNNTKSSIIVAFEKRLKNSKEDELQTALEQVGLIARFRLKNLFTVS